MAMAVDEKKANCRIKDVEREAKMSEVMTPEARIAHP